MIGQRTVGGDRPAFERALPVIGSAQPDLGALRISVGIGNVGGSDQAGNFGGNRGRRITRLLLPALDAEGRAMADNEVCGGLNVVLVEVRPGHTELVGHQNRVAGFVELRAERVGRQLAVDQAVARERAIRTLLVLEHKVDHVVGGLLVAVQQQTRPGFVDITGKNLAVRTEVLVIGVSGGDCLAPGRSQAGHQRPGEGLIFRSLEHIGAQIIFIHQLVPLLSGQAGELRRRRKQASIVSLPSCVVLLFKLADLGGKGGTCSPNRLSLGGAKAQGQGKVAPLGEVYLGGLYQVPIISLIVERS